MDVISTRNANYKIPATQAVLKGISEDGGLFVPEYFPKLDLHKLKKKAHHGYDAVAAAILGEFFDIGGHTLKKLTELAYAGFDTREVVPMAKLSDTEYVMELSHGPTLAFKDMALQVLPQLISESLKIHEQENDILVLTATSGDTGKAAMEGFRDVPRTSIVVFYPLHGVAPMQKLQMVTQEGGNVGVCAVKGNFDDAQNGVKELFGNGVFNREVEQKGFTLSSANSINIGRLVPQVAYYVYAYLKLLEEGAVSEGGAVNFCVPTGNFGNILAAYYAMRMGVPVHKLICASNRNNVLTDFFDNGHYNARREFYKTMSPSMDILISSNLERLLFELAGRDDAVVAQWMAELSSQGAYTISRAATDKLARHFYADFCDERETAATIKDIFSYYGYVMDPHTAVAQCVYDKYVGETGDNTPTVVMSTANPYKFTQDVLFALSGEKEQDAFAAADKLQDLTNLEIPEQISGLIKKPILHGSVVEKGDQISAVRQFIEGELD
ncbi:threonine synthase [Christensenellaceae bacterium OttesenSCG-928-K19]|nr:threonine synthase [Christensenellaceae bacterium OttesenSCG-928-K19]